MIRAYVPARIEWLIDSATGARVPEQADWLVPTKWLTREVGEDKADQVAAFTQVCQVVPLDTEITLAAAEACHEHKLASADAIIFATGRTLGATLLTRDAHFEGLPGVPDREDQALTPGPPLAAVPRSA